MKYVRQLLWSALTGLFVGVSAGVPVSASTETVKNIILIISDGMHLQHEIAYSRYRYGTDRGLSWHSFPWKAPCVTWDVTTYDRYAWSLSQPRYNLLSFNPLIGFDPAKGGTAPYPDSLTGLDSYYLTKLALYGGGSTKHPATDSASAGTAIACGIKTDDGNISWLPGDPANGALTTIAEYIRLKKNGAMGVVTTVPFSHATPAVFVSHNVSRNNYYTGLSGYTGVGIADEIINTVKPDVVIGAGHNLYTNPTWSTSKGYISRALYETLKNSTEYVLAERKTGVSGAATLEAAVSSAVTGSRKLFGLFGGNYTSPDGAVVYSSDLFDPPLPVHNPGNPLIAFSTTGVENPTLAQATVAALRVLSRNANGFFLMVEGGDVDWANHSNDYAWMIGAMWQVDEAVKAAVNFVDSCSTDTVDWSNTLLIVTSDHSNSYLRLNSVKKLGKGELPRQVYSSTSNSIGTKWNYPGGEVTYGTNEHTNEPTMVYAIGQGTAVLNKYQGRWYPNTALLDNTDLYHAMAELLFNAPSVSITSPQNGAAVRANATVTLEAAASDADGTITRVEFWNGGTMLGVATTAPFSITVQNFSTGTYTITATAFDDMNCKAFSAPVAFTIGGFPGAGKAMVYGGGDKGYLRPDRGELARISYTPAAAGTVGIGVYTMGGTLVWSGSYPAAASVPNTVLWNLTNAAGERLSPGVYVVRIRGGGLDYQQKIVVIR